MSHLLRTRRTFTLPMPIARVSGQALHDAYLATLRNRLARTFAAVRDVPPTDPRYPTLRAQHVAALEALDAARAQ